MKIHALILALAFAIDAIVEDTVGAEEVACAEWCDVCQAEVAYRVDPAQEFLIGGYFEFVSEDLRGMISELQAYIENAEYTVAIGSSYCVQAAAIEGDPLLQEMHEELLGVGFAQINMIELFTVGPVLKELVGGAIAGAGDGYAWESLDLSYEAVESVEVSSFVTLDLEEICQLSTRKVQSERYGGTAAYSDGEDEFIIQSEYDREDFSPFKVEVVNEDNLLGEWADLLNPNAQCGQVVSPRGLSDVLLLWPTAASLAFVWDDGFSFDSILVVFEAPEFSIAAGLTIEEPRASLNITASDCFVQIEGEFSLEGLPTFGVTVLADKEEYRAEARIAGDPKELAIGDLDFLISALYPDGTTGLPSYPSEGAFLTDLADLKIPLPFVGFRFFPEPFLNISAPGLEVYIGRFNSVIDTCLRVQGAPSALLGVPEGYKLTDFTIESSTNPVNLTETYSEVKRTCEYGIQLQFNISYEFGGAFYPLRLSGVYFPSDVLLSSEFLSFELEGLNATSSEVLQRLEPYESPRLHATVEAFSVLEFDSFVKELPDGFKLEGYLEEDWEGVFMETFTVDSLTLNIKDEQEAKGFGHFSCSESKNCWEGTVDVLFDFEDYDKTEFRVYLEEADGKTLWSALLLLDSTALTEAFYLGQGASLNFTPAGGYSLTAAVSFMNVPTKLSIEEEVGEEEPELVLQMMPFAFGFQNVRVLNEPFEVEVVTDGVSTKGVGSSEVEFLGIRKEVEITLSDSSLSFETKAKPFQGQYEFDLTVTTGPPINIYTALTSIYGQLKDDLDDVELLLEYWVKAGQETLEQGKDNYEEQLEVVAELESCPDACPRVAYCDSPLAQVCELYAYEGECIENQSSCAEVTYECASESSQCTTSECEEEYTLCQEWTSQCEAAEDACKTVSFGQLEEVCVFEGFSCTVVVVEESECRQDCAYKSLVSEAENATLSLYQNAYDKSYLEMSGFYSLTDVDLVKIERAYVQVNVTSAGLGPGDLPVVVVFKFFSLEVGEMVETEWSLEWDYYQPRLNTLNVAQAVRGKIIGASLGSLTDKLYEKSPSEVYMENIQQFT